MNIIWYIIWNIYCCLGGIEHFQMPENLEALERRKIAYIGIGVLTTNIFWFKDENKIVPCRAENFGWNKKTLLHIKAFFSFLPMCNTGWHWSHASIITDHGWKLKSHLSTHISKKNLMFYFRRGSFTEQGRRMDGL